MPRWTRILVDPRLIVPLLTLLLAASTAGRVFTAPLWGDEVRTWRDGIETRLVEVVTWRHNADHAPLGHLLARAGAETFGVEHAWSLRLGAWACGLLCVPAGWWLGRTVAGGAAGLLVAAMLAVDPNVVFQSSNARMYPPLLLAGIVSLTLACRLLTSRDGRVWLATVGLAVAIAAGLWTHSQMYAVVVPTLLVALGATAVRSARARRFEASAVPVFGAVTVALIAAAPGVVKLFGRRAADPLDAEAAARPFAQLEDASRALVGTPWLMWAVFALAVTGWSVIGRRRPAAAWLVTGVAAMAVVNLLVAANYRPVAHARYLTIAQPSLWLGVAAIVVEVWRRAVASPKAARVAVRGAVAAAFVAACVYERSRTVGIASHHLAEPFAEAVRSVAARSAPRASRRALTDPPAIVVPRWPYATYARYFGVKPDLALHDAAAAAVPARRGPDRGKHARPTREQTALLRAGPITLIGVVPPRGGRSRTAEDPLALAAAIARVRKVALPPIPPTDPRYQRPVVIRFTEGGVEVEDRWNQMQKAE